MPIDEHALSCIAVDYAKDMTSIRGRRVQRLVKREFAGAEFVFIAEVASCLSAVLGLSKAGAAYLATTGQGRQASVVKWLHGSKEATAFRFDLLKDSLPVLDTGNIPLTDLPRRADLNIAARRLPSRARDLVAAVLLGLA